MVRPRIIAALVLFSHCSLNMGAPSRRTAYDWITTPTPECYDGTASYALNKGCDGVSNTCAASFCTAISSDPDCTWTTSTDQTSDYAASIAAYTCKTCTQNTADERCTATWLKANLLTTHSGLKGAYCNDKWLVIFSDGSPGFMGGTTAVNLGQIPQPPGGTNADGSVCRTRSWWTGLEVWKIPLSDVYQLLSTATRYNNLESSNVQTSFPSGSAKAADGYLNHATWGTYGLPAGGPMGVTIAGQSMYPVFADSVDLTPQKCEVDQCNEHVGQGGGAPHLHGDPFGSKCLYDSTKYVNTAGTQDTSAHPPVIGFSMDGPTIYGRYLSTSAPGYSTTLDDCGGHVHDSYAYHYHAAVKAAKGNSKCVDKAGGCENAEYPVFTPGVNKCWKSNIAAIPNFWERTTNKLDAIKPCCGMTEYYANTAASIVFSNSATSSATSTTSTSGTYTVQAAVKLEGISYDQFDSTAESSFKTVIASYLKICGTAGATECTASQVTILSKARRDVTVTFSIATTSSSTAATGANDLKAAIETNAATFQNALKATGGNLAQITGTTTTSTARAVSSPAGQTKVNVGGMIFTVLLSLVAALH